MREQMKIIDVAEFYTDHGGGVKTYINQKLRAGAESGHEIVIIAPGKESREEKRFGGRVIWVESPPLLFDSRYYKFSDEKKVHQILDNEKPDLVEGSSPWKGGKITASWKGNAVKTLIFHIDPVAVFGHTFLDKIIPYNRVDMLAGFFWQRLIKLSNKFDATVTSSDWLAKRIYNLGISNSVSIPFGTEKELFSTGRRNPELRAKLLSELGLPEDATLLITISRFHPEKRLGTIIEGVKRASKHKSIGLIIYGQGPIKGYVDFKVRKAKNIRLMGFSKDREELANVLASSDYFVHGSAAETYGIVLAEAICSGLPLVVPNRGGAAELASPEFSEVYEPGRSKAFERALSDIMNRNRDSMVDACIESSKSDIQALGEHFRHLFSYYEELLEKKNKTVFST